MKLAVIADLHANLTATLAVHEDIKRRGMSEIWVLGDLVGKGPRPKEVVDWVANTADRVIMGNWDARVAGASHRPQDIWPRSQLSPGQVSYLANLPFAIEETFGNLLWRFVHASSKGVFHRVYPHSSLPEQREMFYPQPERGLSEFADAVVYADVHEALLVDVEGRPLINTGSVGNPLDSVLATYLVLEFERSGFTMGFARVIYDREEEVTCAERSDMPFVKEYIQEIRTGRYQKRRPRNLEST
ncbi:metallophosphoesterase family protein [Deinococcus roseus]|uniref:Metallophosphoesterase n=1 Tax=Deinococcus roseus TaxID=392414 RepID=A0ABQ2D092_9DEIO|nr:metallophosphoesterase family protein [Deinococcus roseus]GGJ38051.1 metallophosphoesterase [Deinococcus roseus]